MGNELASITSQHVVFDFTLSTFSKRYHFPNAGKMIFYHFASVDTVSYTHLEIKELFEQFEAIANEYEGVEWWRDVYKRQEVGDPEGGIAPGTAFEDIPDDWVCPLCGVGKEDFSPVEE